MGQINPFARTFGMECVYLLVSYRDRGWWHVELVCSKLKFLIKEFSASIIKNEYHSWWNTKNVLSTVKKKLRRKSVWCGLHNLVLNWNTYEGCVEIIERTVWDFKNCILKISYVHTAGTLFKSMETIYIII